MGDVVELDLVTSLDIPVDRIIRRALEADLESVGVMGWEKDGSIYFSSLTAAGPDVLWLIEKCKAMLLQAEPL